MFGASGRLTGCEWLNIWGRNYLKAHHLYVQCVSWDNLKTKARTADLSICMFGPSMWFGFLTAQWLQGSQTSYLAAHDSKCKCSCEQGGSCIAIHDLVAEKSNYIISTIFCYLKSYKPTQTQGERMQTPLLRGRWLSLENFASKWKGNLRPFYCGSYWFRTIHYVQMRIFLWTV